MIGANQTLEILTPTLGARDAVGVKSRTMSVTATVAGFLHQKNSVELVSGTYQTVEGWQAFLPPDTVIDHTCLIQDEAGVQYRVQGVAPHRDPTGALHHITCMLTKAGA